MRINILTLMKKQCPELINKIVRPEVCELYYDTPVHNMIVAIELIIKKSWMLKIKILNKSGYYNWLTLCICRTELNKAYYDDFYQDVNTVKQLIRFFIRNRLICPIEKIIKLTYNEVYW